MGGGRASKETKTHGYTCTQRQSHTTMESVPSDAASKHSLTEDQIPMSRSKNAKMYVCAPVIHMFVRGCGCVICLVYV